MTLSHLASTPPKQSPPKFQQLLHNTSVARGDETQLTTNVSGFPKPTLEWNKDGLKLLSYGQPRTNMAQFADSQGNATLTVSRAETGDAGEYSCQAENVLG